jgi:anti-sigma regulatory factor (Ser/Thr protein kinase)
VPHAPDSAYEARRALTADLSDELVPPDVIDDALLVLSELVANAVQHAPPLADGSIWVGWWLDGRWVRLEVTDGGGLREPRLAQHVPDGVGGRGLSIVNAVASRWGVHRVGGRSTVWADIPAGKPATPLPPPAELPVELMEELVDATRR